MLTCKNCGQSDFQKNGTKLVCNVCGSVYYESDLIKADEDMQNRIATSIKEYEDFVAEAKRLTASAELPDNQTDLENLINNNEKLIKGFTEMFNNRMSDISREVSDKIDLLKKEQTDALKEQAEAYLETAKQNKIILEEMQTLSSKVREGAKDENVEKYIKKGFTVETLIDNAEDLDQFSAAAVMMRKAVEKSLHKYNIPFVKNSFALTKDDYINKLSSYKKEDGSQMFDVNKANTVKKYSFNDPNPKIYYAITPCARFLVCGYNLEEAKKLEKYWGSLNNFIHEGKQNVKAVNDMMAKGLDYVKDYLRKVHKYFKEKNLIG